MLSYALTQLEKGKINKLVVVPNNSFVANTREIAALPGGLMEKEFQHLGPLIDLLGKFMIEEYIAEGRIELLPIAVARGRNLENCIVFSGESQNLTEDHVKLLLGRIGDNARIFFDGDYKNQIDKKIFRNRNGLKLLTELHRTSEAKLFAAVRLKSVERSKVAKLAEVIDQLV